MRQIELTRSPKGYTLDQDKVVDPTATVERALAKLAGQAEVALVKRASAVNEAFAFTSVGAGIDTSGKGLTENQAKASAVMEFVERHAWLTFDYARYPGYRVASHAELVAAGQPVVDPSYFLYNFVQLRAPEALRDEIVEIPLKWISASTLTAPAGQELLYPINWHNMLFTSNGLASGNTFAEAVVQGLCELVERENVYRLFVERRPGRDIDPKSLTHPLVRQTLAAAEEAGIRFIIKDISSDLGVATVIVRGTCERERDQLTYQGVGQGTHTEPEKAVVRALSEYFEGFSSLAAAEKASPIRMGMFRGLLPAKHFGFHAHYNPDMLDLSAGDIAIGELPNVARDDFKDEAEVILAMLSARGFTVAVVDKTNPEVGIPVVRLFAPKMRSCISTEFSCAPDLTLSAVFFEAGFYEAAKIHHGAALDQDPTWRMLKAFPMANAILPGISASQDPRNVWGRDYQDSLLRIGKTKKSGVAMLQQLAGSDGLLGQLGGMLDAMSVAKS